MKKDENWSYFISYCKINYGYEEKTLKNGYDIDMFLKNFNSSCYRNKTKRNQRKKTNFVNQIKQSGRTNATKPLSTPLRPIVVKDNPNFNYRPSLTVTVSAHSLVRLEPSNSLIEVPQLEANEPLMSILSQGVTTHPSSKITPSNVNINLKEKTVFEDTNKIKCDKIGIVLENSTKSNKTKFSQSWLVKQFRKLFSSKSKK